MKKKLIAMTLLGTMLLNFTGCGSKSPTASPAIVPTTEPAATAGESIVTPISADPKSLLTTNIRIIDGISKINPNENVMFSGLSLNYALAMMVNGCSEAAKKEVEPFLGMNGTKANEYYSKYMQNHNKGTRNKLLISNSFWVSKDLDCTVNQNYKDTLKNYYNACIDTIPMNEKGLGTINGWVKNATDGFIQKALNIDDITKDTASILINAILMDSKWQVPFEKNQTSDCDFTRIDGTTEIISGMHSKEYYYYENEYATAFRKDYDQSEFYFVGILPKETGDFTLESLDIPGLLATKKSTSELRADIFIMLPKVDFETKYELSDVLPAMGITRIFDRNSNNFPGIYESKDPDFRSYASRIIQNDRLIIDEDGTKAAAVTSVIMNKCTSVAEDRNIVRVYLNRPFVALIMDGTTDEPLFIAKIMNINH